MMQPHTIESLKTSESWEERARSLYYAPINKMLKYSILSMKEEIEREILILRSVPNRDHVNTLYILYNMLDQVDFVINT